MIVLKLKHIIELYVSAENATSSMVSLEVMLNASEPLTRLAPSRRGMAVFNITRPATKTGSYILSFAKEEVTLPIKVLVQGGIVPKLKDILERGSSLLKNASLPMSEQIHQNNESTILIPFSLISEYSVVHVGIAADKVETEDSNVVAELLELGRDNCEEMCVNSIEDRCVSTCRGDLQIWMNITLSTYSAACLYWVEEEQSWSQEGCTVSYFAT